MKLKNVPDGKPFKFKEKGVKWTVQTKRLTTKEVEITAVKSQRTIRKHQDTEVIYPVE